MPYGKGTYGSTVGRPKAKKNDRLAKRKARVTKKVMKKLKKKK